MKMKLTAFTISVLAAMSAPGVSLAVTNTAKGAGLYTSGQTGPNATSSNYDTWQSITTLCSSVAGGGFHSLCITSGGAVLAWGDNSNGQLGNNSTTNSSTPVSVSGLSGLTIKQVAGGDVFSVALDTNGHVWAWGSNSAGQLGDNTTTDRHTAVEVKGVGGSGFLSNIAQIAAGFDFVIARDSSGFVYTWGANNLGQLGDGTTTARHTPVQPGLGTIVSIGASESAGMAIQSVGTIYTWGDNTWGELGRGTTGGSSSTPMAVSGVTCTNSAGTSGGTAATGGSNAEYFSAICNASQTILTWGNNSNGQLGLGSVGGVANSPQSTGLGGATSVSDGWATVMALTTGSKYPYVWGDNSDGQFGNGTLTRSSTPVLDTSVLPGTTTLAGFAEGGFHSLVIVHSPL